MTLKHRDRELLRFEWVEPQGVRVVSVNDAERKFLPLEMKGVASDETLWTWLTRRIVPKHRHYIQMMLGNLGIFHKDAKAIIEICKGLSLNDVYWVVSDDFKGAWKDFNLYDNEFSKTLAVMAFTGGFRGEFNAERESSSSPEFTTNGMLAKCWRRRDGRVLLYKSGTEGAANTGFELYSEFYAAQLAEALGNFGYLINNDTNEIVGAAPIFDNGYGLFSLAMYRPGHRHDEFGDLRKFIGHIMPALYEKWLGFAGGVIPEMRKRLARLKGFRFTRHKYYNLPVDRLRKIEDFLQRRVSEILEYGTRADELLRLSEKHDSVNHVSSESLGVQIKSSLSAYPFITYEELAEVLQVSPSSIARKMKELQASGEIRRVGADKNGWWDVCKNQAGLL